MNTLSFSLDMMLDSEMCAQVNDESGKMVGTSFNCYWPVDDDYDAFEVHPRDWLNTAAEIAEVRREGTICQHNWVYRLCHFVKSK